MKYKRLFYLGIALLMFIFSNLLVSSLLFFFHISISSFNILISFILTIIILILILKRQGETLKNIFILCFSLVFIIFASILVSGEIYDVSYDANTYHKVSIGLLKSGWNPVYESIDEFNESDDNDLKQVQTYSLWNDHYARGYHIYAANVYSLTGNIETGKSIYLILVIATFLISFSFINCFGFSNNINFFVSMLLSFNPVIIYQLGSFYNDALIGNLLLILLISLTLITFKKDLINSKISYLLYFITLVILINIKFTGLGYAGIYSFVYYLYIIINKKERKDNLKRITVAGILSIIIGVFLIGYSTYYKNFKNDGHPFYPLYGENKVDIMTGNTPTGLDEMNRFKRFIYANYSETYNKINNGERLYRLKVPFTFRLRELKYYINTDIRVGGYGVFFGGILLITIILFIYVLKNGKNKMCYLIPILTTFMLIVILKDAWWARYLPQLYFVPIGLLLVFNKYLKNIKFKKVFNIVFIGILVFNSVLIAGPSFLSLVKEKIEVEKDFKEFEKVKGNVMVVGSEFSGSTYNLYDKYKNIEIVDEVKDKEKYSEYKVMGSRVKLFVYKDKNC